jgi:hypothetical protein
MPTPISEYLALDHERIDILLERATLRREKIDLDSYARFRQGLLRHIGIEEKILIPSLHAVLHEESKEVLSKIRTDHSAIVALLVPEPLPGIIAALRDILAKHNELEEQNGGFYEMCTLLSASEIAELTVKIKDAPEVRAMPNNPDPRVLEATRRALERAGYNLDDYTKA